MYSIYIHKPKSKAVTKIIKKIIKKNPTFNKNNCTLPDKGFLKISS